jgi:hypothetical protein
MEYLEGEDLADMLKRAGQLEPPAAYGIMEPALLALAAAHDKGIVHRDLKPENIFLAHQAGATPAVKLIDFGISKFTRVGGGTKLTRTGSLLGTPAYMSPEQARGSDDVDHLTDIYAMGVILFEMLTGRLPFTGANYNELIANLLTTEARPPTEFRPDIPGPVERLVMRALSRDVSQRFPSAIEMLEAMKVLDDFADRQEGLTLAASGITNKTFAGGDLGETLAAEGEGKVASDMLSELARGATPGEWAGTRAMRPSRRPLVIGLLLGGLLVAAAAVTLVLVLGGDEPQRAEIKATLGKPAAPVASPLEGAGASEAADTVEIEIVGAPDGARIFYDDFPVPVNPFHLKRGQAIVRLRVEADGFAPFKTSIVPSADRRIQADLTPSASAEEEPAATESARSARTKRKRGRRDEDARSPAPPPAKQPAAAAAGSEKPAGKPAEKPAEKSAEKKFSKGGRGTEIAEDFE